MKLTKLKSSINVENDMHFTAAGRDSIRKNKAIKEELIIIQQTGSTFLYISGPGSPKKKSKWPAITWEIHTL